VSSFSLITLCKGLKAITLNFRN